MDARRTWVAARVRWGWALLAVGVAAGVAGMIAEFVTANAPFNFRVVTAGGILLTALGVERVVRYRAALKDEVAARRAVASERDERALAIRANAGYRAYLASAVPSTPVSCGLGSLRAVGYWCSMGRAVVLPRGGLRGSRHRLRGRDRRRRA